MRNVKVTFTCDRCGANYDPYDDRPNALQEIRTKQGKLADGERRVEYGNRKYLCPSCMDEYEGWMYEEKSDEEFHEVNEETPFEEA